VCIDIDFARKWGAVSVHLSMLSKLYLEEMHYPGVPPSISVGAVVKVLEEYKQFPYQAHDLAILSKVPNQKDLALQHLPLHKCSVSVLAPRRFSFHQFPDVPRKPDNIIGLQDLDTFRRLDHATRSTINAMQRQYGQRVTAWK